MREREASVHTSERLSGEKVVNEEGPLSTEVSCAQTPVTPTSVSILEGKHEEPERKQVSF